MPHYVLRYFFDDVSGTCLWAANGETVDALGYPVDLEMLNLPDSVLTFGNQVIDRWTALAGRCDTAAEEPEYVGFREEARRLLALLRMSLGPEFEILNESGIKTFCLGGVVKIVSGAQTGADRAALDWAIKGGLPHGGWCPKGRLAEDGTLDSRYVLQETESEGYRQRTKRNVADSDGTLILNAGELSDGSLATLRFAERLGKPCLVVQLETGPAGVRQAMEWLRAHRIGILNVAGPRESKRPGIHRAALTFLDALGRIDFESDEP